MPRKRPSPKVDICRFRPERLKALTYEQLARASETITLQRIKRRTPQSGLIVDFVTALLWTKLPQRQLSPRQRNTYKRRVERFEKQIREAQRRCGV